MATQAKNAPKSQAFKLGDEELAAVEGTRSRGRQATPSVYTAEVTESLNSGEALGIRITETVKAPYVMAQLRKAAKQLSTDERPVKVTIWDRSERVGGDPFVGFKAVYAEPAKADDSEAKAS